MAPVSAPITDQDVEAVVTYTMGSKCKLLGYELGPFAKYKTGCLGNHQSLVVKINPKPQQDEIKTQTYFVKSHPESTIIKDALMDDNLFPEEVHFFSKIYPLMIEKYSGERWCPRCFLAKDDVLIYEDLRAQGYTLRDDYLLDESSLRLALTALARFHAGSFELEARLGKKLCDVFPEALAEKMYAKTSKFGRGALVSYETIALMAEKFGMDGSLVPEIYEWVSERVRAQDGSLNVICHGDLWKNNLLFNDAEQNCLLVDFQMLRYASIAVDIGMLLYLHTTPETRKKLELELLKHYYSTLQETLLQSSNPNVKIPSYDDVLKEYCEHRLVGMTYGSIYLPGTASRAEDLAEIMNDPMSYANYFFKDRMKFISKGIEKNPNYEKLLRSVVSELLQEANRVFSQ